MKIKSLTLYSTDLDRQKEFYSKLLDTEIQTTSEDQFSIQVGWTELTFKKGNNNIKYHYCFLIPSDMLERATAWVGDKFDLIKSVDSHVHNHSHWNADSIYFLDGNENIAEIIVMYDLKNKDESGCSPSKLLGVNEIGTPCTDISKLNNQLEEYLETTFWKGNYTRFGTHGGMEGMFLMVNRNVKKEWYPTKIPTHAAPYEIIVESNGTEKHLSFSNGEITLNCTDLDVSWP